MSRHDKMSGRNGEEDTHRHYRGLCQRRLVTVRHAQRSIQLPTGSTTTSDLATIVVAGIGITGTAATALMANFLRRERQQVVVGVLGPSVSSARVDRERANPPQVGCGARPARPRSRRPIPSCREPPKEGCGHPPSTYVLSLGLPVCRRNPSDRARVAIIHRARSQDSDPSLGHAPGLAHWQGIRVHERFQ